jgi:hypothetical protein
MARDAQVMPKRPKKPVPKRKIVPGSGTEELSMKVWKAMLPPVAIPPGPKTRPPAYGVERAAIEFSRANAPTMSSSITNCSPGVRTMSATEVSIKLAPSVISAVVVKA